MKWILTLAAILGALAVILGAFAAHSLKSSLPENLLATFQLGVQYQMYHALALFCTGLLYRISQQRQLINVVRLFVVGIVFFSGSLYALALGGPRWFGPITPIGGVCFIAGWIMLAYACWRLPNNER
jgi:uncharacterized membrane protein YgdD (TMEM256/DUF423 family)